MKKSKIFWIITLIITAIGIGILMFFIISTAGKKKIEPAVITTTSTAPIDDSEKLIKTPNQSDLFKPKAGKTPSDYKPNEVVAASLYTLINTSNFMSTTTGESKSLFVTQKIEGTRVKMEKLAYNMSASSGLVNTAFDAFFNDTNCQYRKTDKIDNLAKTEVEVIGYDKYLEKYGHLPMDATGYLINEETYKVSPTIKKTGDDYVISIELDPASDKGPYWYKREIATNAGTEIEPVFHYMKLKLTIDNSFRILKLEVDEEYEVNKIITATANTKYTEVFSYENVDFPADVKEKYIN